MVEESGGVCGGFCALRDAGETSRMATEVAIKIGQDAIEREALVIE
jgi:hypothetical protein